MLISEVKEKHEDELLELPNVIGVETGLKEVNGEETDEEAIIAQVKSKVAEAELKDEHVIPKEIEGVKTDVVETGEIVIPPLLKIPNKERTDKWRPCPFGVSIAHRNVTAGTQGTLVKREDHFENLSNAHVKANVNKGEKGDPIDQPGPYDDGKNQLEKLTISPDIQTIHNSDCPLSTGIAKFLNGVSKLFGRETRFGIRTKIEKNEVDAALGRALNQDEIAYYVLGPDNEEKLYHRGSREAEVGEDVWVSGRTLGYRGKETGAYVKSKDATIRVRYPSGIAVFKNQVHIKSESKFSAGGMSGSCIAGLKDDGVISLLFAGNWSGTHTYGNRIGIIEEKLKCKVVNMKEVGKNGTK